MTASEALVLLNDMEFAEQYQGKSEYTEMLLLCKETLEKQIAKKPLDKTQEYDGEYGLCPCCEQIVADYKEYKRCSECGQALDWS